MIWGVLILSFPDVSSFFVVIKHDRLPSLLSWPLPSPQTAHGWLFTVLCVIISHSSSSQPGMWINRGFEYCWLRMMSCNEDVNKSFWGIWPHSTPYCDQASYYEPRAGVSFWKEALCQQTYVWHQSMLLVMIHCTSRRKRSPSPNNVFVWRLSHSTKNTR